MRILSSLVLGCVLLLSACDPFTGDNEVAICESLHGILGRQSVTAVTSGQEAGVSTPTHDLITVNLVPVTGGNGGRVSIAMSPGEHYFFMSDVPLAVEDDQGNARPVSDCPLDIVQCEVSTYRACRKVNVSMGATYHLDFGPTAATTASFVIR